jgi:hypothetical protein
MLGDFIRTEVWNIRHHDSMVGCGIKIDIVHADSKTHHAFQSREGGKKPARHLRAAHHDDFRSLGQADTRTFIRRLPIPDSPSTLANQLFIETGHGTFNPFRVDHQALRHVFVLPPFPPR